MQTVYEAAGGGGFFVAQSGAPPYSESFGDETSVVRLHSANGPHEEMDRGAVACFDQALTDVVVLGRAHR